MEPARTRFASASDAFVKVAGAHSPGITAISDNGESKAGSPVVPLFGTRSEESSWGTVADAYKR